MSTSICVGIVALLQPVFTARCIRSVFESKLSAEISLECIVVLNGADEFVLDTVIELSKQYPIQIITNPTNIGYAAACNQILKQTSADYICYLHNDVVLTSQTLAQLYAVAEKIDPKIACLYPLTNYANEHFCCISDLRKTYETLKPPNKELYTDEILDTILQRLYSNLDAYAEQLTFRNFDESLEIIEDATSFCSFMHRAALEKVKGFNEVFKYRGYEDKELVLRFNKHDLRFALCRTALVHHHGNLTTDGENFEHKSLMNSQEKIYRVIFDESKVLRNRISPYVTYIPPLLREVVKQKTTQQRFLYFSTNYLPENAGGAELSAHETHKQLLSHNIDVYAIAIRNRFHKKFEILQHHKQDGVNVIQLPEGSGADLTGKLRFIIERYKPQVVLTHSRYAEYCLALLRDEFPMIKRLFFFRHQTDILDGTLASFLKEDGGTQIISNSKWMQQQMYKICKRDSEIVFPVVFPQDCVLPELEKTRRVVTIGNGVLSKGIKEFLTLAGELTDIQFEIWGTLDPTIAPDLLPDNVSVCEWSNNIKELYRHTRVLVNLSIDPEPFGRTLMESLMNNIPVIAHKEGGPLEFVKDGGVLTNSTNEIVETIRRIFEDETYYKELCKGAQEDRLRYNPYRENAKLLQLLFATFEKNLLPGYQI